MEYTKIRFIEFSAYVRFWEDCQFFDNETPVTEDKIPFRNEDKWGGVIDVDNGIFLNWPKGISGSVHFKVCDEFSAKFKDLNGKIIHEFENEYVPNFMCPLDNGFGDYIIMDINNDGSIDGFVPYGQRKISELPIC